MAPPRGVPKGASSYVKSGQGGKVRRADSFAWEDAPEGTLLYPGDTLNTPSASKGIATSSGGRVSRSAPGSTSRVGDREKPQAGRTRPKR